MMPLEALTNPGLWARIAPLLLLGCASRTPAAPAVGVGPNPASITKDTPGGDAPDPHWAALTRQLDQPWGSRPDKDRQLLVPLVDSGNWKRVRYWALDHFVGFRYGEDYHAVNVVFVHDVADPAAITAEGCMRRAEQWAEPQLRAFQVELSPVTERIATWRETDVLVHSADAKVAFGFGTEQYSVAWVAYPAYSDACLVFALAVAWDGHQTLARAVLDRWIDQGVARLKPRTRTRPYRK